MDSEEFARILTESNEKSKAARSEIEAFERMASEQERRLAIAAQLMASMIYTADFRGEAAARAVDLADALVLAEEAKWGEARARYRSPDQVSAEANDYLVNSLKQAQRLVRQEVPMVEVVDLGEPNKP